MAFQACKLRHRPRGVKPMPATSEPDRARLQALDLLATLVAVVDEAGTVRFANAALEDALGLPARSIEGGSLAPHFAEPEAFAHALAGARRGEFAVLRYEAALLPAQGGEPLPVHAIVAPTERPGELVVELLPLPQQARQQRDERAASQALSQQALLRNLAHEIKNPLGGLRGAAQLLEMEIEAPGLRDYTQVIIREADRLQQLVDRLLAPHRRARVLGAVNIHEVCERVRALIRAEFGPGLRVVRDYDVSIPDLQGDREQLIQAVLNIARNAAQALDARRAQGDAEIVLRTRVARQVTVGQQRHRLALDLHVIDNGPGVPEEIRERVFEPLVSGRDDGSGLGLTLAQTVVQQHRGLIELDSRPGRTDFRLLLPLP